MYTLYESDNRQTRLRAEIDAQTVRVMQIAADLTRDEARDLGRALIDFADTGSLIGEPPPAVVVPKPKRKYTRRQPHATV